MLSAADEELVELKVETVLFSPIFNILERGHSGLSLPVQHIPIYNRLLVQADKLLLKLYSTSDPLILRDLFPAILQELISCDRASFNELEINDKREPVIPTPVPAWWPQLGDVYQQHFSDHPIYNEAHPPIINRAVSFDDPGVAGDFKNPRSITSISLRCA